MAVQKGTGFTNLNRILQANRGNRLGQTVSGGIQQQTSGVQTQVKSSQQQFEEEAQKGRLDTEEAAQKRQDVLGRFQPSSYTPDMSQFQASSGLQQRYDQGKTQLQQAQAKQQEADAAKKVRIDALKQKLSGIQQYNKTQGKTLNIGSGSRVKVPSVTVINPEYKKIQDRIKKLSSTHQGSVYKEGQLDQFEQDYQTQLSTEQEAFRKAEIDRLIAANAPTEQEIQDFTRYQTGTYTGPKGLQDLQTLVGSAQQTEQLGQLARSEGGRQELLRRFVGGAGYTPGQRQLDTTLLGQEPGGLTQAARQTRGALEGVARAEGQASGLAQEYVGRAKEFGEQTQEMIGETKTPFSSELDKRVAEAQAAEDARIAAFQSIQNALTGTGDQFKRIDKWARTGLALQEAADRGVLSQSDIKMLMGEGDKIGLLQRGGALGLDINKLLSERLTNQIAQNLSRTGFTRPEDIATLNALDKLSGKVGSDLEFGGELTPFEAGKTGFNIGSLEEYIKKTEAEKAAADKAYADRFAAEQARYMNQALAGAQGVAGGAIQAGGAALNQVLDPQSYYNPGQIGQNVNQGIQGVVGMGTGLQQLSSQGAASIMEGLAKMNIGGKSLAKTEGGRQLLKLVDLYSKSTKGLTDAAQIWGGGIGGATQDLLSGNIGGAFTKYINTPGNITKSLGKSLGGALKGITGGGIKISDEDLKEDIDFSPEDVQRFMDRIKPAAYNYKEEVKDSPLASKNRELGVMAQDLEKSKLGKEAVHDTDIGKVVDYDNLEPKMLASIAALNNRLKELEKKKQ